LAIVPTGGLSDQITDVFNEPPIDAWKSADSPAPNETEDGVMAMPTVDARKIVALAVLF
jgi:hypothetical protein